METKFKITNLVQELLTNIPQEHVQFVLLD